MGKQHQSQAMFVKMYVFQATKFAQKKNPLGSGFNFMQAQQPTI